MATTTTTSSSNPTSTSKPPTYASTAKTNQPTQPGPQEWTTVGPKNPPKGPKPAKPKRPDNKITLIQTTPLPRGRIPGFSPISLRNAFNKAFNNKGIRDPIVATVSRLFIGNIVVTTTPKFNADYLLEKKSLWSYIIPFKAVQKPQEWFKVVVDIIPTYDFNVESRIDLIIDEIKTFNIGFTLVGTPYWLTSPTNRQAQLAGSIVVSFPTEGQAKRAIKDRLYIAGILARVRKYHPTASTI